MPIDAATLRSLWHAAAAREERLRAIVTERLVASPPPQFDDAIVATYFFAFRTLKLERAVQEISYLATLNTTLGYSRLLVRDRTATVTGNLFVDNVSVVPEPSSVLLALGGVGSLLALRFRRHVAA